MQRNTKSGRPQQAGQAGRGSSASPHLILREFCKDYHLHEVKEMLWEWLTTALSKQHTIYDTGRERSNLIFFYEKIIALVEAVYRLQPAQKTTGKPKAKNAPGNKNKK